MKKFVTFLMVGCCMILCSNDLFSSVKFFPNSSLSDDNCTESSLSNEFLTDCGTVSGFAFFANDGSASENGQGCIDVVAQDFTNILLFQWTMEFSSSVGTFSHIEEVNLPDSVYATQPSGPDLITISWQSANFSGVNVPPCEVLFQVCFDATGQDGDQMDVRFTGSQTNIEVRDEPGTLLDPDFYTGTFSISGTGGGNPNPPTMGSPCGSINGLSFYAEDVSVAANGQSCVGVTAQDFENVMSFQWSMAYDSTLIELDTAYATGLPANSFRWGRNINSNNIGTPGPGILGSGFQYPSGTNKVITVSWLEPNFSGVTIADCDELFKLCFDAVGSNGQTSPLVFSDRPTNVEVGDPDFNVLLNNINSFADGSVVIGSGGGPVNPPTTTTDCGSISGLSFYSSTVCTTPNQNSCVEVSASSFNNVMSFQWSMAYDSTIIELDTAYAVDLPANSFRWGRNINSNNIGTPGPGILGAGFQYPAGTNKAITVSWLEPNFAGVTLDDCDVLFNLCFDAVGNAGQISPVVFSDRPTAVEVGDPDFNVLLNNINSFSSSTFEISDDCSGTTPPTPPTPPTTDDCGTINGLSFYASDNCTDPAEDVCVEVKAAEFTNVMSFQWSMAYDSTIIELDTAYAVDLPANSFRWGRNINSNNIGTPGPGFLPQGFQFPAGTNKVITVSWLEPNFSGITLDDCDVLFNLCFTPVGNAGQISPVVFIDRPTNVEIGDPDFNVLLDNITPFSDGQVELNTNCAGTPPPADPVPTPSTVNITNVNCRGNNSGGIVLQYNQSTAGLSFNWSPGGATTKDLGGISAGTYRVTITEGTQDTVLTYTVTEPNSSLSANSSNVDQITCNGLDNGSISVVANGGTGAYSYSWGGNLSGNTATQNNLAPGSYNVTVSDANGCTQTVGPIAITEPQPVQVIGTVTDVDCSGRSNGRINLSVSGGTTGTSGYSYSWNPSASNQNLTNIPAGNYSVTVEDANGCQTTDAYVVNAPAPIVITSNSITGEANGSDGAIDINVTGGILNGSLPDYIYTWSQSANSQITQDASNLTAGTHTVQVRDAVGCSASATFTVDFVGPAFMVNNVVVTPSCPDVCNGAVDVQVSGGINPQITWTSIPAVSGLSGFSLSNLCVGTYSYVITDNGVMVAQGSEFVGVRLPLVITGTPTDEVNGNDGSIQLDPVQNSVGTLSYSWTNVASSGNVIGTGMNITGLQAGTYEVSVTDSGSGCSNTARFVIEDKRPVEIDGLNVTNSQCAGDNGGAIEFTVTQGLPDFTIEITGGPLGQPITEVRTVSPPFTYNTGGLPEGNYMVRVTDSNQSIFTDNFTISEPDPISASALIYPHTSTQNGRIDLSVTGGTTPYDIDWGSGVNPSNLQPGTYRATVTDGNGCEFITSDYSVTRFRIIEFNKIDANCSDAANGSLSIAVDGGNLPYQYRWTDSGGSEIGTDAMISGLAPGTYTIVVTGNLGTEITETYTITEQSTISTSTVITTNFSGFNVSCFGGTDGQARVTPANGISPYTYKWEDGQDTEQAFNLSAGTILVTVTDAVGCSSSSSVTLTQPPAVEVEQDVRGVDCFGDTNGEIRVFTSGGVRYPGVERYIYQWDEITFDGSTVRNVSAGDYELLIEDANGCQENVVVTVPGPTRELFAEVVTTDSDGDCNGSARAEVVGGTAPYFYRWINRFTADSTDRELLGLCSDEYTLVVIDANGCETSAIGRVGNTAIECLSTRAVITPDGGGLNEEFIIWCIEQYPDNTLEIYNRWGQLVWEQDDYDNTWRGKTMRQGDVPDGAYFYVFRYVLNGETLQTKGSFTLLRD